MMLTILIIGVATLFNYQYTRNENYKKCISEKTESSYCVNKIKDHDRAIIILDNANSQTDQD
jgi:hypothetical protein